MSTNSVLSTVDRWFSGLSLHWKIVLTLVVVVALLELGVGRLAPRSRVFRAWKALVEGVGAAWTAVLLSIIYVLSVGPVSLAMRLFAKDPLDRKLDPEPSFWRAHDANPLGADAASRHQF